MKRKFSLAVCMVLMSAVVMTGCGEKNNAVDAESADVQSTDVQSDDVLTPEEEAVAKSNQAFDDLSSMDKTIIEDFAKKIQTVVADADLKALSELCSYPVYVENLGAIVESADEITAADPYTIFTPSLQDTIAAVDVTALEVVHAGVVMSTDNSIANITFNLVDGELKITGINDVEGATDAGAYVSVGQVENFALAVQDAFAGKDMDILKSLMSYPVYVIDTEVSDDAALDKIGADAIFTDERCAVIAGVDCTTLKETEAGFVMCAEGTPNVTFDIVEGQLAITGIN